MLSGNYKEFHCDYHPTGEAMMEALEACHDEYFRTGKL